ncbi:hypothetical protein [Streptomyces sp. NPDC057616]|uniref:hypothetical protein n=1 Tax=Streptomyces sp. NPDC057616 TaxID=3346183 RepID=UPI0036B51432
MAGRGYGARVDLYRQLAHQQPDAYRLDLAMYLDGLGIALGLAGRRDEGLTAAREAVALSQQLAQHQADLHRRP